MDAINIELRLKFSDISELRRDVLRNTIIHLKNGDVITFYGQEAVGVFKKLSRNFAGEHLD